MSSATWQARCGKTHVINNNNNNNLLVVYPYLHVQINSALHLIKIKNLIYLNKIYNSNGS